MLKHGSIIWAGKSSQDLGIVIEKAPNISRPARKFTTYTIPGRSGDIIEPQNAWSNYIQSYSIWAGGYTDGSAQLSMSAISAWLLSPQGYQRLEDNFEPDIFREAYFAGPIEAEDILSQVGKCEIQFNCKPQRYLKIGEKTKTCSSGDVIFNPTQFEAKPLIKVYGSGNASISINGSTLTITGMTDYLYIDCETMDIYRQTSENKNSLVSGQFPTLAPESNTIVYTNLSSVEITPRYFII